MEVIFKIIESIGGSLASIITILLFLKMVIYPFFTKLEIKLTKDIFFQLTSFGELFFPKVIIYSPLTIQVINCSFELKGQQPNTQHTSYNCKAELFGSIEKNTSGEYPSPSFYFPKSSPDFLLMKEKTKEILIRCHIIGSKSKIQEAFTKLHSTFTTMRKSENSNNKAIQKVFQNCSSEILSNIKIENGNYTLICQIQYKYRHFFIPLTKTAESKIDLKITEKDLASYKNQTLIEDLLMDYLMSKEPKNYGMKIRYPQLNVMFD